MNVIIITLSLLLAASSVTTLAAWDVEPCGPEHRDAWAKSEERLESVTDRHAPDYVPHPYPNTPDQAWEDFLFYHRRAFEATPFSELRPTEQRFFEVVDNGRAKITGHRVVNWSQSRCGPERERAFYFLLSVVDGATGDEITRVAVGQSGVVHSLIHRPAEEEWRHLPEPLQDLEQVTAHVAAVTRARPTTAQYVAASGTLRCDVLLPCVALRGEGSVYVQHGERGLFRLATDRGPMRLREGQDGPSRRDAARELRARGEHLLSLHHGAWIAAVPVDP